MCYQHFIDKDSLLYDIKFENNAIEIEGAFCDRQFLVGKGAGSHQQEVHYYQIYLP